MPVTVCRWGILGAANIARKNWKAIRLAENATLTAVASREPARAKEWLDANQSECPFPTAPTACNYDELLKRTDVDAGAEFEVRLSDQDVGKLRKQSPAIFAEAAE